MKRRATAVANNDLALVLWEYETPVDDCLGFNVVQIDSGGHERFLPASVGFEGDTIERDADGNPVKKDTSVWPVQRFKWRDFFARRGGTYRYRIVPMVGTPGKLVPRDDLAVETPPVKLTPDLGPIDVYFNRGLISTQAITRALPRRPDGSRPTIADLIRRVEDPGDPLRGRLAGGIEKGLLRLLERAKRTGGTLLAALYELEDEVLERALIDVRDRLQLILSNTGDDDRRNAPARARLKQAGVQVHDRMLQGLSNSAIGHNKFVVLLDPAGKPVQVLTGSTNWTVTGLCTSTNNAMVIESTPIAGAFADYWARLLAAGDAQPVDTLRTPNRQPVTATTASGQTTVWFSPNTQQMRKPSGDPPTPVDIDDAGRLISEAKDMVLFLMFRPGAPSIVERAAVAQSARPSLIVYGAATDDGVRAAFGLNLVHRDARRPPNHVVTATNIDDDFAYWSRELRANGHAIIHDKIVVIDPQSDTGCAVITGSHNLGFKASYSNDENLVVVRGNRRVAAAYAAHAIDVYDHFRWRFQLQENPVLAQTFGGLKRTSKEWQDKYFKPRSAARRENAYWLSSVPFTG